MMHLSGSNSAANSVETEIRTYLFALRRWAWLVVLCVLTSTIVAYTLSQMITPVYRASTTLLIDIAQSPEGTNVSDFIVIERSSQTWAQLMEREATLMQIANELGLDAQTLKSEVVTREATPIRDTQLMRIDIESISPSLAAAVANTMPTVFNAELKSVQTERYEDLKGNLSRELEKLDQEVKQKQIQLSDFSNSRLEQDNPEYNLLQTELSELILDRRSMRSQLESIRLTEAQSNDSLAVVEEAVVPITPVRPRVLINTLLAAMAGLFCSLGFIVLIELLDNRIRSPRDLQRLFEYPILGAIPTIPKIVGFRRQSPVSESPLVTLRDPRSPISESYRGIRTSLQYANIDNSFRTLMVTSASAGEGKSTTAANLAIVMAQAGYEVALIDGDLRRPSLHKIFGVSPRPGLIDALLTDGSATFRFSPERQVEHLRILPVGMRPPNPADILGSVRMQDLIDQIKEEVDFVIIDTPPVLAVTDPKILSNVVDKILLVVSHGTERSAVVRSIESLQMANAPIVGCVFNRLEASTDSDFYAYSEYELDEDLDPVTERITAQIPVFENGATQLIKTRKTHES